MEDAPLLFAADDPPSKKAVLSAALKLFVRDGYDTITIRAIAAESGYTNPALFKFFKTKEDLGLHLFEKSYGVLLEELGPFFQRPGTLEEVVDGWVGTYLALLERRLDVFLFVHDHFAHFWPRAARRFPGRDLFTLMRGWLAEGRRTGAVSDAVPIEVQTAALGGFFHQFAKMVYLKKADLREPQRVRAGAKTVLLGLLRPAPQTRRRTS